MRNFRFGLDFLRDQLLTNFFFVDKGHIFRTIMSPNYRESFCTFFLPLPLARTTAEKRTCFDFFWCFCFFTGRVVPPPPDTEEARQRRAAQCRLQLERAVALGPEDPQPHLLLATALLEAGPHRGLHGLRGGEGLGSR